MCYYAGERKRRVDNADVKLFLDVGVGTLGVLGQPCQKNYLFYAPYGLSGSPNNDLIYVADTINNRIQIHHPNGNTFKFYFT